MDKKRIILYCDRAILACLCFVIFCLPFSKAAIESFIWPAIFLWLLKRALRCRAGSFWGLLPENGLKKALGIFIAVNFLAVIFSSNLGLSLRAFFGKELKFLAIYFMVAETINSRKRLNMLLITILASALLIVFDSGVQFFRGIDFLRGYAWRNLTASFSSSVGIASWLTIMIPLFLGLLLSNKGKKKRFNLPLIILIIILITCLLATYIRGAWMGLLIGFFLVFGYIFKNLNLKVKLSCLSAVTAVLVIFFILPQPLRSKVTAIGRINFKGTMINTRIKSIFKIEKGTSALIRLMLWKEALKVARDYPLTGCGLNTYSIVARDYKSFEGGGVYPHNSYLQMLAETGLLGLLAFFWVLFTFFKIGLHYLNQRKDFLALGLLSGILAFLAHAFFDTHIYSLQLVVLFWFMLGLTVALIKLDPER